MDQIFDILMNNKWLLILIIFGILGNLGGSSAQKARKNREREAKAKRVRELVEQQRTGNDPFAEPAVETTSKRVEEAGEDVSQRIRDILGRAQAAPEPPIAVEAVPVVLDRAEARENDRTVGQVMREAQFETSLTAFEGGFDTQLEVSDFKGFAAQLTDMDNDRRLAVSRGVWHRPKANLPFGLNPQQLVVAQLLMGPPRALQPFENVEGSSLN